MLSQNTHIANIQAGKTYKLYVKYKASFAETFSLEQITPNPPFAPIVLQSNASNSSKAVLYLPFTTNATASPVNFHLVSHAQCNYVTIDSVMLISDTTVVGYVTTVLSEKNAKDDYRFSVNGQHKENEIAGYGNHNSALFWEYSTQLGRRWNVDPVKKEYESGYACFGNTPIWSSDVNGDDSTLASGSKTWTWTAEEGDTYGSISKRTGVPESELKKWNSHENNIIPTGSSVNISAPTSSTPTEAAGISCDGGMIYVNQYAGWNSTLGGLTWSNQGIMLNFTPPSGNSIEDYRWYQTICTNDPANKSWPGDIHYDEWKVGGTNGVYRSSDQFGTWRSGMKIRPGVGISANDGNILFSRNSNQVSSLDAPGRWCLNSKSSSAYWRGTTSLIKMVDIKRIIIATFSWGFERNPCTITSYPLRFNQKIIGSGDMNYHIKMLDDAK